MLSAIPGRQSHDARTGGQRWRENAEAQHQYLRRDMRDALIQRQELYPETWASHVLRTVPFIWSLARELCTPYLDTVARRFVRRDTGEVASGIVLEVIDSVYAEIDIDATLHEAHQHLVAIGCATVHVWPDPARKLPKLLNIPPHDQEVVQGDATSLDVRDVKAWRFRMPFGCDEVTQMPRWALGEITATKAQWIGGTKVLHNRGIFGAAIANPLGQIPVAMLRASRPSPGEWWPPVPEDLLQGQRAVNHDVTDVGHVARLQGYGQPKMTGMKVARAKEQKLGPESIVVCEGEGADFDFARPDPNIAGYLEQNNAYLRDLVGASGLNPQSFLKSSGITALAKQIELIDRSAARKGHFKELRKAEQRIFDLVRLWVNTLRGGEVIPDCRVEVEYREPIIPADPLHDAQAIEKYIAMGLSSEYRERAKLDGISLDEAKRRVDEDTAATRDLAAARLPVADEPKQPTEQAAPKDAPPPADDVAKTALNGAQIASLQAVLVEVSARRLPSAAAREMLTLSFPDFDTAAVDRMLAAIEAAPPATTPEATAPSARPRPLDGEPPDPEEDPEDPE